MGRVVGTIIGAGLILTLAIWGAFGLVAAYLLPIAGIVLTVLGLGYVIVQAVSDRTTAIILGLTIATFLVVFLDFRGVAHNIQDGIAPADGNHPEGGLALLTILWVFLAISSPIIMAIIVRGGRYYMSPGRALTLAIIGLQGAVFYGWLAWSAINTNSF